MNDRERFLATMHYRERDRCPIMDFSFWDETIELWYEQGLPGHVDRSNSDAHFGMEPLEHVVIANLNVATFAPTATKTVVPDRGVNVGLLPSFDSEVLEDRGDHEVVQQADGVRVLRKKFMSSIPSHQGHLLVDRNSWVEHYRPRLDPDAPDRLPDDWDEHVARWKDPDRDYPLFLPGGSLYGWIRNWMGVEAVSYVVYDDPAWFEEMVGTVADCTLGVLTRVLESGVRFDGCSMWEDMCYNAGPLLSPALFERYLTPHYRRLTDLLRRHGVDVIWVDCDGKIDELVPLWLEAGVNCMMPIEIGTWDADPVAFRREFGRDLLLMGGFDKHVLARSKDEIEREIRRLAPLVEDGGYIPFCDHRVPPDVPYEHYCFYVETARSVWGRDVNLKPCHFRADQAAVVPDHDV